MKKNNKILIIFFLIYILFSLTGCTENNNKDLKAKVISELDYVSMKTVDLLNKLNNISFENYSVMSHQVKLGDEEQKSQLSEKSQNSEGASGQGGQSGASGEGSSERKWYFKWTGKWWIK